MTNAAVRELLERRARALARPAAAPRAGGSVQLVTFALGSETYALESRCVVEVFRLGELALLPGATPPVFGLTTWRGGPLVVLDLRPLLGVPATALDDLRHVVVMGAASAMFGVLVDAVHEVREVASAAVLEPPEGVAVQRTYLWGVTGDALLVLDGGKLLQLGARAQTQAPIRGEGQAT